MNQYSGSALAKRFDQEKRARGVNDLRFLGIAPANGDTDRLTRVLMVSGQPVARRNQRSAL